MRAPFVYDANADIEERCQIYLGRHEATGRFTRNFLGWFFGNEEWIKRNDPSDEEIRAELMDWVNHVDPWTGDPNRADFWNGYEIDKFQKFLPEIEWRKAILTTVPLDQE